MRIISGKHKGRRLIAPKGLPTRPTTDFAKEGLFSMIANETDIEQLSVLDLFSGTGNISFEFASRGAKKIVSIDENYRCVQYIKHIIKEYDFKQSTVFKNDVFRYLKKYDTTFDLIFADPPYSMENINEIHTLVFDRNLLNANGLLILEHNKNWDFSEYPNFMKYRNYGNVNFSIFKK